MKPFIIATDISGPITQQLLSDLKLRAEFASPQLVEWDRSENLIVPPETPFVILMIGTTGNDAIHRFVKTFCETQSVPVIAIGPATDAKWIIKITRAGADVYIDEGDMTAELNETFDRFLCKRSSGTNTPSLSRLFGVLSASGGCGSSTIAANLSVILAKRYGRCHLIDLNPGNPDLAPLLDLKPQYTMTDLSRNEGRLDRSMYEKLLTMHESGVALLAAPTSYDEIRSFSQESVTLALNMARESAANVVVDLEDCFHDEQLLVLQQSSTIFLVTRPDFTTVRNTKRIIDSLIGAGIPSERIEVILNHYGRPGELPKDEVEQAIHRSVSHTVTYDPDRMGLANNTGVPTAMVDPESPIACELARMVGVTVEPPKSGRLPHRLMQWAQDSIAPKLQTWWTRKPKPKTNPMDDTVQGFSLHTDTDLSHEPASSTQLHRAHSRATAV